MASSNSEEALSSSADWKDASRPVSSSPDEGDGADKSLSVAPYADDTKSDEGSVKNDNELKGSVDTNTQQLLNDATSLNQDAVGINGIPLSSSGSAHSVVDTSALQLLGGKKRKRKHHANKSIAKKKVLSSFQEDDDEAANSNNRMMDEFLESTHDDDEGGDHADNNEGKLTPTERNTTTMTASDESNNNNIKNHTTPEKDDTPTSTSSSIHHTITYTTTTTTTTTSGGAVIPPDRVMSPMPQNERENVPLCHSPNVPDGNSTTATGAVGDALTTTSGSNSTMATLSNVGGGGGENSSNNIGSGGNSVHANGAIRTQQQNNVGQMRILQQQQQQASQQLAQRFSSSTSSSSGEGAVVAKAASSSPTNIANTTTSQTQQQQQQQQTQPPGWRVKLYRLNMDGTWDDCGTGRIQFYYARGAGGGGGDAHKGGGEGEGNTHHQHGIKMEGKKQHPTSKNLFRELGEPMLCMRAEVSQKQQSQRLQQQQHQGTGVNNSNSDNKNEGGGSSSPSGEKVLLRTRVLLHEAYQCQGGNIITWCEPFHAHGKQKEKVDASTTSSGGNNNSSSPRPQQQQSGESTTAAAASPAGVDLALSFQDNAGCKDIWQHILNVQSCAREMSNHFANNTNTTSSSSTLSIHTPLSPIKTTSSSTHAHPLHNSPNSPDHDLMEDKLIAGGGGTPLGGMSSRPSIWTKDSNIINNSSSSNVENRLHSHNHAPSSNKSSPSSSDDDEEEKQFHDAVDHMTAVSMAAAAAASYTPKDGNSAGGGGMESNVSSPLYGNGGGGGGTPHGCHMNNNQSDAAAGGVPSPLQLPKSPTWEDLQNIGDVISGVHFQQREDFLIFLSQKDCAYVKLLLHLFPPAEERGEDISELAVIIKTILLLNDPEIIEYVTTDAPTFELVCAVLEYDPELRGKANHRDFIRNCAKFRTVVKMEDEELVALIHHLFRVTYLRDSVLRPTMDESSLSTLVSLAQFTQSDIIKGVIMAPKAKVAGGAGSEVMELSYLARVIRLLSVEIDAIRLVESDKTKPDADSNFETQNNASVGAEEMPEDIMWQQHLAPQDSSLSSRLIRRKGCLMFLKELSCKARTSLQQPEKDEFIENSVSNSKLLLLLGAILSDPNIGVDEQGAALEIISVVAMHDPCVIRRHCLQGAGTSADDSSNEMFSCLRPDPNDHREVIFICPPNDMLLAVLFVMATATDAGILLQTSEIIRIILDTDIVGDQATLNGSFMNEENDINAMNSQNIRHDAGSEEQNAFLALFYDRYIQWLVAPFQYKMFISKSILPLLSESNRQESFSAINLMRQQFKHRSADEEESLTSVGDCSVRASFTLEILSFCVRAHVYRMKFFILRTRMLGTILKMLCQKVPHSLASGGKCLKLASLKFLRSVLSVKDEFYHRHIVQYNLFAPVFDAFRVTPVGSNLISSAVLEMCDFICTENIKSLLEYIVTKHLKKATSPGEKSLEDIANPYVDTFVQMRRAHEENIGMHLDPNEEGTQSDGATFSGRPAPVINKKALEDQRKYREAESEDSYFNDDDDDDEVMEPLRNDQNMPDAASLLADVSSLE